MTVETTALSASILVAENARYIVLRCPPRYLNLCRSIAGGRWSKALMAWSYPCTAAVAIAIRDGFGKVDGMEISEEILELAETQARAAMAKAPSAVLDVVPGTKRTPWRHQAAAYNFAKALPATMLAMDMGVGKSAVVVWLVQNLGWKRVLILCPKSVLRVWPSEFEKHAMTSIPVLSLDGNEDVAQKTAYAQAYLNRRAGKGAAVVLLNYEAAWREPFAKWALNTPWDAVVLDESHRIKSPSGTTSRFCAQLGRRALRRLCLTGTPLPHSPADIYAQYRFLDPGIFGSSYSGFKNVYTVSGGFGGKQIVRFQNQQDLERRMGTIMLRVDKKDALDLPEFLHTERKVRLSPKAQATYNDLEKLMVAQVESGEVTASNALVKLLRLAQLTGGHVTDDDGKSHVVDTAKQDMLEDILEDLAPNEPVVVFCRFRHDLDVVELVAKKLKRRYAELSGRRRDALTEKATMSPNCDIAGVQIASGGVGIDLTRARYSIYYSISWSLGEFEQSLARVHRPGQTRPVVYTHIIAEKTVDETAYKALRSRKAVVEAILNRLKYVGGRG